jgi:hypothetical protein
LVVISTNWIYIGSDQSLTAGIYLSILFIILMASTVLAVIDLTGATFTNDSGSPVEFIYSDGKAFTNTTATAIQSSQTKASTRIVLSPNDIVAGTHYNITFRFSPTVLITNGSNPVGTVTLTFNNDEAVSITLDLNIFGIFVVASGSVTVNGSDGSGLIDEERCIRCVIF